MTRRNSRREGTSGLLLAVAREHRAAVVELHLPAACRAFTLTEFANTRQAEHPDFDDVRVLPLDDVAASLRGVVEHLDEAEVDVVNPYWQGREPCGISTAQQLNRDPPTVIV